MNEYKNGNEYKKYINSFKKKTEKLRACQKKDARSK